MLSIPIQLGMMTQLTRLYLSRNSLTGSIPTQLGMMTQLTRMWLFNTALTGSIPESICLTASPLIDCGKIASWLVLHKHGLCELCMTEEQQHAGKVLVGAE